MAMSLNGMIASKSGNEDFLSDTNWKSFGELVKSMVVLSLAEKLMRLFKNGRIIILTTLKRG